MISSKTLAIGTSLTLLAVGSSFGFAADHNQAYIEACRQEIQQYYGEDRSLAVVNKRRVAEGTRVTLAARSDKDNAQFINCWIANEERTQPLDLGNDKVAASISPVPVIR
ncbi:hypothetical protein DWB85_12040 [Seongchinamella sediminis]|uniref:Uncharacterized protein n=1 Tax=Seongchinamella sediminis TaxID=2283635 RepID=A0A3L7DXP5_9GAMM|nr:hypothetical protein [Seongchinamella sediminis]RLQ21485.1 hypothetical protein DWB85_12040 [Seongchinamella sediminis]